MFVLLLLFQTFLSKDLIILSLWLTCCVDFPFSSTILSFIHVFIPAVWSHEEPLLTVRSPFNGDPFILTSREVRLLLFTHHSIIQTERPSTVILCHLLHLIYCFISHVFWASCPFGLLSIPSVNYTCNLFPWHFMRRRNPEKPVALFLRKICFDIITWCCWCGLFFSFSLLTHPSLLVLKWCFWLLINGTGIGFIIFIDIPSLLS